MKVAVLDYNAGNLYSVVHALRREGAEVVITDKTNEILSADKVIFPGQGEARTTMNALRGSHLSDLIADLRQPVLGICIGMQLMCEKSEENDTSCLSIFPEVVRRFQKQDENMKIPHMGWNTLHATSTLLFKDVPEESFVYYVHSFYVPVCDYTIARTSYGGVQFSAAIRRDNFFAVQFHPEKSGATGAKIIRNFLELP